MRDYKKLEIWQKALSLCMKIYDATDRFPDSEKFGLSSQMQRAAVSIPSNIAEGSGRRSTRDFHYFLGIAKGSLNELQTQMYIATGRKYIREEEARELNMEIDELGAKLFRFMNTVYPEFSDRMREEGEEYGINDIVTK